MNRRVKYTISEVGEVVGGSTPSTKDEENYGGEIAWITPKDLSSFEGRYIKNGERNITTKGLKSCSSRLIPKNSVLFSSRAPIGYIAIAENELCTNQGFKSIVANENRINYLFLYYYLVYKKNEIEGLGSGTTFKEVSGSVMKKYEIYIPENVLEQRAIAATLSCLDDKIEVNNSINKTLDKMAQTIFKRWFVDFGFPNENGQPYKSSGGTMVDSKLGEIPKGWKVGKAEDFFEIAIGKTPPRKEPQWFTTSNNDIKWVSISDMRDCGVFIFNTSEYLTKEAVEKHNVKVVPANTVLLSFKLTVGRIAITNQEMTTNEAIAHFKTNKSNINEFLYYYLLNFNYDSLGNTSSIAIAVNSKIIKAMSMMMASEQVLNDYHNIVLPLISEIRKNQEENQTLTKIRDLLLPKLMSGEIRVTVEE